MKTIVKRIIFQFMKIMAFFYPYTLYQKIKKWFTFFYSRWILNFIPDADHSVSIGAGLDLRGGKCMTIGAHTCIGKNCILNCWTHYGKQNQILYPRLIIGQNCNIGDEAQYIGMPIIATNVGGVSSLLKTGKEGILVPANHPYEMAFNIIHLFKHKEIQKAFSVETRKRARERHNPQSILMDLLNCYKTIIDEENSI